jgi:hypothetical protein
MARVFSIIVFVLAVLMQGGCRTTAPIKHESESNEDVQEALTAVAGALSGREFSEEEKRNLQEQIRTDPDAQSAVQAIGGAVSGKDVKVKYCPVGGERYAPHLETCPVHHVPLEMVDP